MQKRGSIPLIVGLVVVVAAGCGGSSGGTGASPDSSAPKRAAAVGDPQSARQFVAAADAICGRLNTRIVAITFRNLSLGEVARVAPLRAALEQTGTTELTHLAAPASLAHDWHEILLYRTELAEELAKLGRFAKLKDRRAIAALSKSKARVHKLIGTIAKRDGFTDCAKVG